MIWFLYFITLSSGFIVGWAARALTLPPFKEVIASLIAELVNAHEMLRGQNETLERIKAQMFVMEFGEVEAEEDDGLH